MHFNWNLGIDSNCENSWDKHLYFLKRGYGKEVNIHMRIVEKNNILLLYRDHNKMLFPVPVHSSSSYRDIWEQPSSKTSPKKWIKYLLKSRHKNHPRFWAKKMVKNLTFNTKAGSNEPFLWHYREQLPHNVYIHPDANNKTICRLTSHQPNILSFTSRLTLEHIHEL